MYGYMYCTTKSTNNAHEVCLRCIDYKHTSCWLVLNRSQRGSKTGPQNSYVRISLLTFVLCFTNRSMELATGSILVSVLTFFNLHSASSNCWSKHFLVIVLLLKCITLYQNFIQKLTSKDLLHNWTHRLFLNPQRSARLFNTFVSPRSAPPNISRSSKLFLSKLLPVTTATCERSFSSLRRLKTYLRSTIKQTRLNS